jgi:DNA-binding PadR family transcriptional regulator
MEITLRKFLRRKGAIGLLSLLHERPMTYSEIEPEIEVTSDTIITRRNEAAELGLLNISLGESENGTKKVYHLTDMGEFLTDKMAREGLISNYRKMRTLEDLVDEHTGGLIDWVADNPSQLLQFEDAQDGTILRNGPPQEEPLNTESGDTGQTGEQGGDTTVESNRSDADLDPPQRLSEHSNVEPDGESETGKQVGDEKERPSKPSDSIPDTVKEKDISNTEQGSLTEMATGDSGPDSDSSDIDSEESQ